jgi:hypothetical protein
MSDFRKTREELVYYTDNTNLKEVWIRADKAILKRTVGDALNAVSYELHHTKKYRCWEDAVSDLFKVLGLLENEMNSVRYQSESDIDLNVTNHNQHSVSSPKKPLWKELDDKGAFGKKRC